MVHELGMFCLMQIESLLNDKTQLGENYPVYSNQIIHNAGTSHSIVSTIIITLHHHKVRKLAKLMNIFSYLDPIQAGS